MTTWTNYGSKITSGERADKYNNRSIEGRIGGAHQYTRAPQFFEHFFNAGLTTFSIPLVNTTNGTGTATVPATGSTGTSAVPGGALIQAAGTGRDALSVGGLSNWFLPSMAVHKPIVFEARAKFVGTTTATDGTFALGFFDANAYTAQAPYIIGATGASGLTTKVPTNAAGFFYSSLVTVTGSGYKEIYAVSSLAATGTLIRTGVTKDSNFHVYRVQIDVNGNAKFSIDDKVVGRQALAVSTSGTLTPYFNVQSENSHLHTMTVDYLFCGAEVV
jgi:hypothetical protein